MHMQSINTNKANEYTSTCRAMSDCTYTLKYTHMLDCIHIYKIMHTMCACICVLVCQLCDQTST